ncbi:MAG: isochorismatase family protein, partial [bacterium]|nr:isochorismatase family protein [bacterium]
MWKQLKKENVLFTLIDFQDSFFPILKESHVKLVRKNILLLIKMFKQLDIPMIGTEHYKKGLGDTEKTVLDEWNGPDFTDKITFSCCGNDAFLKNLADNDRHVIVVAGLETQIC